MIFDFDSVNRYYIWFLSHLVGLAAAIPKIDLFISLIGAVASSTLALIAPAIMHTLVFWDEFDGIAGKLKITRNVFLFILGIVGMVFGTIYSIKDIIEYFISPSDEGNYPKCADIDNETITTLNPEHFIPIQM